MSASTELKELNRRWQILEKKGVTMKNFAAFLVIYGPEKDIDVAGLSAPSIRRILRGAGNTEQIQTLFNLIKDLFKINWETGEDLLDDEQNDLNSKIIKRIERYNGGIKRHREWGPDETTRDLFEGLYVGIVRIVEREFPQEDAIYRESAFLMDIDYLGNIEIVSNGDYQRDGFIFNEYHNVYFVIDTERGHAPEFYLTRMVEADTKKNGFVEEFVMCGTWLNRDDLPVFGDTLVKRVPKHSPIRDLIKDKFNGELRSLKEFSFLRIRKTPEFDDLRNRAKADGISVRALKPIKGINHLGFLKVKYVK